MNNNKLTGIERELVLQYLIDGNVPVTLTLIDEKYPDSETIHPLTSQIFPVAIKGENIKVSKNGTIKLENTQQSVSEFGGKNVKVEFYFNRVGLFFISKVQAKNKELLIKIPDEIDRILDTPSDSHYDFSALIYFECQTKKDLNLMCIPWQNVQLFSRPAWKSIPLENQKNAKTLLEKFVEQAKIQKNCGNGIQLISVCNYLTFNYMKKMESLQDRIKPLNILYVDHERLVLGLDSINHIFRLNDEYGVRLSFSLKNGPIISRDIFITGIVNNIYKNEIDERVCVDLRYTSIQEEDLRFLYEKTTQKLFI